MKRCATSQIIGVDSGAMVKEKRGDLDVVAGASVMKRGGATRTLCGIRTAIEQKSDNINVALEASEMKRLVPTSGGAGYTRIEVQPTPTHITVLCRITKPVKVDPTTLLTQR
eukprot:Rhum_TRINITY_DN14952_c1_g4::Rhum_TRINITY_DN14952_c1_g4_i1::g.128777::m.128777